MSQAVRTPEDVIALLEQRITNQQAKNRKELAQAIGARTGIVPLEDEMLQLHDNVVEWMGFRFMLSSQTRELVVKFWRTDQTAHHSKVLLDTRQFLYYLKEQRDD
ncbi:MAG: hypothetical protein LC650_00795 [Actinobacteria bacterium]|nr:hypothetical protein [Actinomycetota bacterium]